MPPTHVFCRAVGVHYGLVVKVYKPPTLFVGDLRVFRGVAEGLGYLRPSAFTLWGFDEFQSVLPLFREVPVFSAREASSKGMCKISSFTAAWA